MSDNMTLKERIADGVRQAIIKGDLVPGARLQEVEIAQSYETSRTPVREAFHQLESEGFLVIRPRRGAIVRTVSGTDAREFYEMKNVLEGFAARKAIERISQDDIGQMQAINDRMREVRSTSSAVELQNLHNELCGIFIKTCGNSKLIEVLDNVTNQFQRCRTAQSQAESLREAVELNDKIIDAFRKRDADLVETLVSKNCRVPSEQQVRNLKAA